MNPLLKGYLIGLLILLPMTLAVNVTGVSPGLVAISVTLGMGLAVLITVKLYADSKGL